MTPPTSNPSAMSQELFVGDGFVYFNEDTGEEYSLNHPVESGEVPDATDIRRSTAQEDHLAAELQTEFSRADDAEAALLSLQRKNEELVRVDEAMVDRAMKVQGLRSDRKGQAGDRHWMRQSLLAALQPEYDPFPGAPGLYQALSISEEK